MLPAFVFHGVACCVALFNVRNNTQLFLTRESIEDLHGETFVLLCVAFSPCSLWLNSLPRSEQSVQVCDATMLNSSNAAWFIKEKPNHKV